MNEPQRFWQRPPNWLIWFLLCSLSLFALSMWTVREGHRFQSRPLEPEEVAIVEASLKLWEELCPEPQVTELLSKNLEQGLIRAMDQDSFDRAQERSTFGYTDERGRILLNPELCFAALHSLGPECHQELHLVDLVRTTTTLYHEYQHLSEQASEEVAYLREWSFIRRCRAATGDFDLERELHEWELEMAARLGRYARPGSLDGLLIPPPPPGD